MLNRNRIYSGLPLLSGYKSNRVRWLDSYGVTCVFGARMFGVILGGGGESVIVELDTGSEELVAAVSDEPAASAGNPCKEPTDLQFVELPAERGALASQENGIGR